MAGGAYLRVRWRVRMGGGRRRKGVDEAQGCRPVDGRGERALADQGVPLSPRAARGGERDGLAAGVWRRGALSGKRLQAGSKARTVGGSHESAGGAVSSRSPGCGGWWVAGRLGGGLLLVAGGGGQPVRGPLAAARRAAPGGGHSPHTVIGRAPGSGSLRNTRSSQDLLGRRSKTTRCPASAPQRSMYQAV